MELDNSAKAMNLGKAEKAPSLCSSDSASDSESGPHTPTTAGSIKSFDGSNQKSVPVDYLANEGVPA